MVFGAAVADSLKTPSIAVWGYGGDLFDKELTKCALDSPRAIEALQFMADLVVKHNVNPAPRQLQGTNVGALFGAGRIGLLAQGQQLGYTRTLGANQPAFSWGVAALPKGPAGRFALNIGTAYALTKGSKQPEAAWEVLKFISSPEFSRAYMGDGLAAIAPRRAVMADVLKSPSLPLGYKEVVDYSDSLRPMPTVARWAEVSGAISKHFARLWTGDVSVQQVVSDLSTEVKPLPGAAPLSAEEHGSCVVRGRRARPGRREVAPQPLGGAQVHQHHRHGCRASPSPRRSARHASQHRCAPSRSSAYSARAPAWSSTSARAAEGAVATGSGNAPPAARAASRARRVLPTPPGPVRVTRRTLGSRRSPRTARHLPLPADEARQRRRKVRPTRWLGVGRRRGRSPPRGAAGRGAAGRWPGWPDIRWPSGLVHGWRDRGPA